MNFALNLLLLILFHFVGVIYGIKTAAKSPHSSRILICRLS